MDSEKALTSGVLNIGRLGTDIEGIVNYYTKHVDVHDDRSIPSATPVSGNPTSVGATSSYYLNNASGRWVGSLQERLGVAGAVDVEAFRKLLEGRHPVTGEALTPGARYAQAKNTKDRKRRTVRSNPDEMVTVTQASTRLDLSTRQVRRLLERGSALDEEAMGLTWAYLQGVKTNAKKTGPGRASWQIAASEVERFANARQTASMRPGFDLTLRPPKSVSILWALGRSEWSEIIAQAHRESVDEVIAYYESDAIFSRKRVKDEQLRILTDGLIGAAFDHRTSRAGDPLLHTHVVTFNVTHCVDGEWRALDGTTIYEHAKTGGYLYQAHMRHLLSRQLGVQWTEVVNGCAEIEGIPQEAIDAFSKRREEIECAVAESGYSSAKAHQTATLDTRRPKGSEPEPPLAFERWWEEARALGLTDELLASCVNRAIEHERLGQSFVDALDATFEELASEHGLTQMMSSFARRDVIRELAERSVDACAAVELQSFARQFEKRVDTVRLNAGGKESDIVLTNDSTDRASSVTRYSTAELLQKEAHVLEWAQRAFSGEGAAASITAVESALQRHQELSAEQVTMVRRVTRDGHRLNLIAGVPGSGKTYGIRVATEAFVATGIPVVGAALSADAGSELESSIDLIAYTGREATTVAKLLDELEHPEFGGFKSGTVLILDEASMLGTRMLHSVIAHLDKADGSLVLLGDPDQHGSVETGGVYQHLVKTHGDRVIHLRENNRQTDEVERKAIAEFRDGRVKDAIDIYDGADKTVRSASLDESHDAMVSDWFVDWQQGDRSPMLTGRNSVRASLNERARARLAEAGLLGSETLNAGEREFCVGDGVVARKNGRRLRSRDGHFVKNGSTGTVVGLDNESRSITVNFEKEGTITLPSWYLDKDNLDHSYARTTYGVQGKTLGNVAYQPTDISSFEEGYVAITRGKSGTRLYIVEEKQDETTRPKCCDYDSEWTLDGELVADALQKRRAKLMARDIDQSIDVTGP